jgi:short-subunit dehydrogenase
MQTPPMAGDPQAVAEYAYRQLTRNKAVMVPGFTNNLTRIMPSALKMRLAAMMTRLRKE